MSNDADQSLLREAVFAFFEEIFDELNIDPDRLMYRYGVEVFGYYSYDVEQDALVDVTSEEFKSFKKLRKTFANNCTCKQYEGYSERYDAEIGASRLVSDDGAWTEVDEPDSDALTVLFLGESNVRTQKMFKTMLVAHDLSHIAAPPRSGAHFIKGWADPFSDDWYDAETLDLLGQMTAEDEFSNFFGQLQKAYRIGRARSDQIWRQRHFETSRSGAKQASNLKAATRQLSNGSTKRAREKQKALQKLWVLICRDDPLLSRNDSKAADAIFAYLGKNLTDHAWKSLKIKKTASAIGPDAIRRYLKELRGAGKI